jgi:hypothetical protein
MNSPVRARHRLAKATGVFCVCCGAAGLSAQVFTVDSKGVSGPMPEFHQTSIELSKTPAGERNRQELIRGLQAEQGFAMRRIPMGHKGLVLRANGALENGDEGYRKELYEHGAAAQGGDRVLITDVAIEKDRIVFLLNGGPDRKHRFLRHLSIGVGGAGGPVARDDTDPTGARITLVFDKFVPEMTGQDVMDLLHPLIQFAVESPKEAYTDTLPAKLRDAILNHHVLVGMDKKMVYMAMGQPQRRVREQSNGLLFEEWIYGEPPKPTQFVRFSGDRVIQTEMAALGAKPEVRAQDETDGYLAGHPQNTVQLGDQAATAEGDENHPTLLAPGEKLPENPHSPQKVNIPPDIGKERPAPAPQ